MLCSLYITLIFFQDLFKEEEDREYEIKVKGSRNNSHRFYDEAHLFKTIHFNYCDVKQIHFHRKFILRIHFKWRYFRSK